LLKGKRMWPKGKAQWQSPPLHSSSWMAKALQPLATRCPARTSVFPHHERQAHVHDPYLYSKFYEQFGKCMKQKKQVMMLRVTMLIETCGFMYGINYQPPTEDEDEKNELEELKQRLELLTKSMKEVLGGNVEKVMVNGCAHSLCASTTLVNTKRVMKTQMLRINLNHFIMSEVKKAAADKMSRRRSRAAFTAISSTI